MASYHQVYPRSQKASYRPGDIVDFLLTFPSSSILLNRIKISGTLTVSGISNQAANQRIFYDASIGIHGFVNNITCSTVSRSVLENRSNYPRYVKMKRTATKALGDLLTDSRFTPELVCPDDSLTTKILINKGDTTANPIIGNGIPFSFYPEFCLNACAAVDGSVPMLSYAQSGDITVSLRLVQALEALYGADSAGCSYTISDLRLDYETTAMADKVPPVNMLIISEVKQILTSSSAQINVNLPLSIYSMSSSFLRTDKELSSGYSNTLLEMPTGLNKVYFQFNDSQNNYLAYPIETIEDTIENYLDSFPEGTTDKNDFTVDKISRNQAFGVGIAFSDAVSLANSNFGVNLSSTGVSSTNQFYMYMFFRSYATM